MIRSIILYNARGQSYTIVEDISHIRVLEDISLTKILEDISDLTKILNKVGLIIY